MFLAYLLFVHSSAFAVQGSVELPVPDGLHPVPPPSEDGNWSDVANPQAEGHGGYAHRHPPVAPVVEPPPVWHMPHLPDFQSQFGHDVGHADFSHPNLGHGPAHSGGLDHTGYQGGGGDFGHHGGDGGGHHGDGGAGDGHGGGFGFGLYMANESTIARLKDHADSLEKQLQEAQARTQKIQSDAAVIQQDAQNLQDALDGLNFNDVTTISSADLRVLYQHHPKLQSHFENLREQVQHAKEQLQTNAQATRDFVHQNIQETHEHLRQQNPLAQQQFHYNSGLTGLNGQEGGQAAGTASEAREPIIESAQANEQAVHETVSQTKEKLPRMTAQMEQAAADFIRDQLNSSDTMAHHAVTAAQQGASKNAVECLADFARDTANAIDEYINGTDFARGIRNRLVTHAQAAKAVFNNPTVMRNLIGHAAVFLHSETGRELIANEVLSAGGHAVHALVDYSLTVVHGDSHDRKYAAGQLAGEIFAIWATVEVGGVAGPAAGEAGVAATEGSTAAREALTQISEAVTGNEAIGSGISNAVRTTENLAPLAQEVDTAVREVTESAGRLSIPEADLARVVNKSHHIFGPRKLAEHKLGVLLEKFSGDQVHAFKSLEEAAQTLASGGEINGIFTTTVLVRDNIVTVSGRVIEGVVRIGTAFIP